MERDPRAATDIAALQEARERLARFDARVRHERLLERLRAHRPRHPWLLMFDGMRWLAAAAGAGVLATLVVPLLSSAMADRLALLDAVTGLSPPLVLAMLGLVALALALGARRMAVEWGGSFAPLLPDELRERQGLLSDVQRLGSLSEVHKRTPLGGPPRADYEVPNPRWTRGGAEAPQKDLSED